MKKLLITLGLLTLLGSNTSAFAAEGVGNGGGAWVCQNNDRLKTVRWAQLVDIYEAKKEFQLPMKNFGDKKYQEIFEEQKVRLFSINRNLYEKLESYFDEVEKNIKEVDVDLEIIDDALYRVKPPLKECLGGKIQYIQLANFTHYGTVLVNKSLFNNPKLEEVDKAALIFHEAIYAFLRNQYRDENSVRARELNGVLFSDLNKDEILKRVEEVLGYLGSAKMKFVKISAGTFIMGSPENEYGRRPEREKQRKVTLTRDFEMMTTEVTQSMYFEITGHNPSFFKKKIHCPLTFTSVMSHATGELVDLCPNNPIEMVNYSDVHDFIVLLNAKTKKKYRLPTEAEWEYAARAGTKTAYWFGNDTAFLFRYAIYGKNSGKKTHPVAPLRSFANLPNGFGLYDMYGNVREMVQDWFTCSPRGGNDPTGPAVEEDRGVRRVCRGGSWSEFPDEDYRSAARASCSYYDAHAYQGFRLVRTLPLKKGE